MYFIIAVSLLPVIIIGIYIYSRDRNKESEKLIARLLLCGVLAALLTLVLSIGLEKVSPTFRADETVLLGKDLFVYIFLKVALIEEFSKAVFVYLVGWRSLEFDETYDAIVYSALVALGFAAIENVLYVFSSNVGMLQRAALRAVTAVPCHAILGIVMGYLMSKARIAKTKGQSFKKNNLIILSLLLPTLIHAIYNWLIFSRIKLIYFYILLVIMFIFGYIILNRAARNSRSIKREEI